MIIGSRQRINATQNDIAFRIRDREINSADVVKSLGMHILIGIFRGQSIFIRFQKKFHPLLARLKEPDHLFHAKQQFRYILL